MSRVIKFRAWDKDEKRMIYVGYSLSEIAANGYELDGKNLEWLEFTGLHDKNGTEIYEGDVVEALDKHAWVGDYDFIKQAEIVWWSKGFYAKTEIGNLGFYENNVGVIGNIFENPELLKGSK